MRLFSLSLTRYSTALNSKVAEISKFRPCQSPTTQLAPMSLLHPDAASRRASMCSSGVKAAAAPVIPAVAGRRNCLRRRHGCQGPAWSRSSQRRDAGSDPSRGVRAATQRGRDRSGVERRATWGGGSSAGTFQVLGRRGKDLPRVQNVRDPGAGWFKSDAGGGESQRGVCGPWREG
jgi:hypothetical protein